MSSLEIKIKTLRIIVMLLNAILLTLPLLSKGDKYEE